MFPRSKNGENEVTGARTGKDLEKYLKVLKNDPNNRGWRFPTGYSIWQEKELVKNYLKKWHKREEQQFIGENELSSDEREFKGSKEPEKVVIAAGWQKS